MSDIYWQLGYPMDIWKIPDIWKYFDLFLPFISFSIRFPFFPFSHFHLYPLSTSLLLSFPFSIAFSLSRIPFPSLKLGNFFLKPCIILKSKISPVVIQKFLETLCNFRKRINLFKHQLVDEDSKAKF